MSAPENELTPEEVAGRELCRIIGLTPEAWKQWEPILSNVRAAENEACARIAENCEVTLTGNDPFGNAQIASAIRSRKDKEDAAPPLSAGELR